MTKEKENNFKIVYAPIFKAQIDLEGGLEGRRKHWQKLTHLRLEVIEQSDGRLIIQPRLGRKRKQDG